MALSKPTVPTTARIHPQSTSPGRTVAMSAVAATLVYVRRNMNRLRIPLWSAIAPMGGADRATRAMEAVTDRPPPRAASPQLPSRRTGVSRERHPLAVPGDLDRPAALPRDRLAQGLRRLPPRQ